VTLGCS